MIQDIYLDTCALSRLTDDPSQQRVSTEAEAVERILELVETGAVRWFSSPALYAEVWGNPDPKKRAESLPLLNLATALVPSSPAIGQIATGLQTRGFGAFDALHLAICQQSAIPWLLTVDDRFLNLAQRQAQSLHVQVVNPIDWLQRRSAWLANP